MYEKPVDLWITTLYVIDSLLTPFSFIRQGLSLFTNISTGPTTITTILLKKTSF